MQIEKIIPLKLLIDINENGTYKNTILLYKIKYDSGQVSQKTNSISVNTKVSVPLLNNLLSESINFAKEQEKKGANENVKSIR